MTPNSVARFSELGDLAAFGVGAADDSVGDGVAYAWTLGLRPSGQGSGSPDAVRT